MGENNIVRGDTKGTKGTRGKQRLIRKEKF